MLKDEGVSELLPACNTVIFDEAHQLPETATLFFGETVSQAQIQDLVARRDASPCSPKRPNRASIADRIGELAGCVEAVPARDRSAAGQVRARDGDARSAFAAALDAAARATAGEVAGVAREARRARRAAGRGRARAAVGARRRLTRWKQPGARATMREATIRWLDVSQNGWQLHTSPLSIASIFEEQIASAREGVDLHLGDAGGERRLHALPHGHGLVVGRYRAAWASPFDYANQALLYVPRDLPAPNQPIAYRGGDRRARCRCSRRAAAARSCCSRACARSSARSCCCATRSSAKASTIRSSCRARARGPNCSIASASSATRCCSAARASGKASTCAAKRCRSSSSTSCRSRRPTIRCCRRGSTISRSRAGNPFVDYQIPQAAISLKQGAGRLIRSETDRGVLMICDTRLIDKPYGKRLWQSLPPMKRTRELDDVLAFFDPSRDG